MAIIVIHGSQASGKTFHAEAFRQHYGCTGICDDFLGSRSERRPRDGYLVLTYLSPQELCQKRHRGTFDVPPTLVPIEAARAAIGVGPVRTLAEWRAA